MGLMRQSSISSIMGISSGIERSHLLPVTPAMVDGACSALHQDCTEKKHHGMSHSGDLAYED